MLQDPFPDPDPADDSGEPDDGPEPDDGLPPGGLDDEGPQQGLFLSVPAGHFDPDRFTQSGPAAEMPPDSLLATIMDTVTSPDGPGVAGLGDDQLIGVIAAARRLESRAAWYVLAAEAEFTARAGENEELAPEFAADELACELHLTAGSAARQMDYADTVTARLPRCLAALRDGRMHPVHLRIIEEETRILSAEDAAKADVVLAEIAGSLTYGKLRSAVHRLVLELDPESVARRKDAARKDAQVRPFREDSGNAGLIGRELPPDEVLASWQHVERGPWTCGRPVSPAPCKNSASAATSTCCKNETPGWTPPSRTRPVTRRPALGTPASLVLGRTTVPARTEPTAAAARATAAAPLPVPRAARAAQAAAISPIQVPVRAWLRWSASPFRGPSRPAGLMAWPRSAGSG